MKRTWLLFGLLAILGTGIRLFHLTDPPLDFHPTRQMHSALIAREFYLTWRPGEISLAETEQRALGNRMARYEPPLFETLVAKTCLWAGTRFGFHLWVARVYDLIFWLLGALGVFLLARRLTDEAAALFATGYWWLLPFAIHASRSFQPDPLMTVLLVWTAWAATAWTDSAQAPASRKSALLLLAAVVFGAFAGVVKAYGVIFAAAVFLVAAWARDQRTFWKKPSTWLGLIGIIAPTVVVYFLMPRNAVGSDFLQVWTLRMFHQLLSPRIYGGWLQQLNDAFGGGFLLLALLGVTLGNSRLRAFATGWGLAYVVYGLLVPFHIATHSYYQLPLLPLVAVGLAAAAHALRSRVAAAPKLWQGVLALGLLAAVIYPVGITAWEMSQCTCREEAETLTELGQILPRGSIVALTSAYGYPLMYYGNRPVDYWPTSRYQQVFNLDAAAFARQFAERTANHDYFLVTDFVEFARQKTLRYYLSSHYPVLLEGEGFLLYDLRHPLEQ